MKTFQRLLIANRGEIAFRILRTAKKLGLHVIVAYSDADRETLAVQHADEAYRLGPAPVGQSYLDQEKLLDLAKRISAQAIHPGYGLLSENSAFARRVREVGMIWVGPSPESMDRVSSKSRAKLLAQSAGVPTVPGFQGEQDLGSFLKAAEKIGYPALLKAAAGGGGRGIRKVSSAGELEVQIEQARSEAKNAFGDDEILIEKYIDCAHHVEVQIFGDQHGQVVHLGERDCSTQRRKQKIIEESPSPVLSDPLRTRMTDAAVKLAKAANYTNAGTVEFLVTPSGEFYFLEINTRLQVEHPVTELVTGLDLVEWQLRVADGEKLPVSKIHSKGHAIEARLCAEDPYDQYRPQTGRIEAFSFPKDVRVDHFLTERTDITPYYDSMLAKIIVHAETRQEAIRKLESALDRTWIAGLTTNRSFLKQILESVPFTSGKTFTRTWDETPPAAAESSADPDFVSALASVCLYRLSSFDSAHPLRSWSNTADRSALSIVSLNGQTRRFRIREEAEILRVLTEKASYEFLNFKLGSGFAGFSWNSSSYEIPVHVSETHVELLWQGRSFQVLNASIPQSHSTRAQDPFAVTAPMDGTLIKILAKPGETVRSGQVLAVLEAMKMQMELSAACDGVVHSVLIQEKTQVRNRQLLIQLSKENKNVTS